MSSLRSLRLANARRPLGIRAILRVALATATLTQLCACDGATYLNDPYRREGSWRPPYSNDANLRAMVAVPSDLVRGMSDQHGDGQQMDAALERLRSGNVKRTADTSIANALPTGSSESGK